MINNLQKKINFLFLLTIFPSFILSKNKKTKIIKKTNKTIINPKTSSKIIDHPKTFWEKFINFLKSIWDSIKNFFKKIFDLIKYYWNSLKSKFIKTKEIEEINKERLLLKIVTIANIKGELINKSININGVLIPKDKIAISIPSKMDNFKITYLLPDNVSFVKKGDILVKFDVQSLIIQKEKNQEQINELKIIYEKEKTLLESGSISKKEALEIFSRLNKLEIEQGIIEDQLKNKEIKSPVDAIVNRPEQNIKGQNARTKRSDLFILYNPKSLLMEGYISPSLYDEVFVNDEVEIVVFHHNNINLKGKIINKEEFSDQNTGVYKILISISIEDNNYLIGQPAQATIKSNKTVYLHKVPEKSLFFDNGNMNVFILMDNHSIKRPVSIVKNAGQYLYVSGLPENVTIVTDEANILNNGDLVKPNKIVKIEDDTPVIKES